jgi:hypothetical protein
VANDNQGYKNTPPVVIDLGKARKRNIRKLKRGRGKLYEETQDVIDEVREGLGPDAAGKEVLPVILVYKQKRKKRGRNRGSSLFPFLF